MGRSGPMRKIFETELLKCTSSFTENWRKNLFSDFLKATERYVM